MYMYNLNFEVQYYLFRLVGASFFHLRVAHPALDHHFVALLISTLSIRASVRIQTAFPFVQKGYGRCADDNSVFDP
jgi:hypothetical protein